MDKGPTGQHFAAVSVLTLPASGREAVSVVTIGRPHGRGQY